MFVFQLVRAGKITEDSPEESSTSTPSSSSSSSSDNELTTSRHDSGLADSVSTQEDADSSLQGMSFRQVSTESDVFMETDDGCEDANRQSFGGQDAKRRSLKRQRSSDSD